MGGGLNVPRLEFLGQSVSLHNLGLLFTIAWLLGAINSFNLIDGVDGLAGSVGVIFSLTFGCIALLGGRHLDAIIAFSLAGSLLGFLRFNISPASIYLGDAGSMLIGLVLGTIALRCSMKQAATLAFAAPLAIWSIPMFDAMAAVVRRKLTGRSIYATDRGHIHHVLLTRGMTAIQAVAVISSLCIVTSVGAVTSWYYDIEWLGVAVVLGVIGLLVATRMFGHVEFVLLNARLFGLGRFLSPFPGEPADGHVQHASLRLQGTRSWEELWRALVESAEKFHIVRMQLNLTLPRLHEDFYATWTRGGHHKSELLWKTDIPLVVDGLAVGRLNVTGLQNADSASSEMSQFIDFVETLETQLTGLIDQVVDDAQQRVDSSETSTGKADDPLLPQVPATSQ
jgi:UDP-GlcNAc:undecaprenyl-phosphate GlcNAc-1-phosphate transferase